jgi:hypothetical protein
VTTPKRRTTGRSILIAAALAALVLSHAASRTSASEARIPFELKCGLIVVQASIDGATQQDFILDTGCGSDVMLSLSAAGELGLLTGEEPNLAETVGAAQFLTKSRRSIGRFAFGGVVRRVEKPAVIDLGFVARQTGLKVAGLIGQKLLDDYVVTIDYPNREIVLRTGDEACAFRDEIESEGVRGVNLVRRGTERMLVEAKLGDMPGYYLLDTGAARGILYEPAATALKRIAPEAVLAPARSVQTAFEKVEVQHATVPRFRIGDVEFVDQEFALHDAPVMVSALRRETGLTLSGTIGSQLLSGFVVTIDSERSKVYLARSTP